MLVNGRTRNTHSFRVIHTGRKTKKATPIESPTESLTDTAVNETGDVNLIKREKVVGDEDLGGGLVYADACFWNEPM